MVETVFTPAVAARNRSQCRPSKARNTNPPHRARNGQQSADPKFPSGRRANHSWQNWATAAFSSPPITSCTNTSNPSVMLAAGLLAKKSSRAWSPGQSARQIFPRSRLPSRNRLPQQNRSCSHISTNSVSNLVGYGCTTCIGNSGPLAAPHRRSYQQIRFGLPLPFFPAIATSKPASIKASKPTS